MRSADPPHHRALAVAVTDQTGRSVPDPGLRRWLARVAPARARGLVTVAIVSDRVVRRLNRVYARHDAVTDVLTFPAGAGPGPAPHHLGDIVIARGRAAAQAREAGHSIRTEFRVLALHGLLHLIGYDHHVDGGRMARAERRLRRRGGLPVGLIERASDV